MKKEAKVLIGETLIAGAFVSGFTNALGFSPISLMQGVVHAFFTQTSQAVAGPTGAITEMKNDIMTAFMVLKLAGVVIPLAGSIVLAGGIGFIAFVTAYVSGMFLLDTAVLSFFGMAVSLLIGLYGFTRENRMRKNNVGPVY